MLNVSTILCMHGLVFQTLAQFKRMRKQQNCIDQAVKKWVDNLIDFTLKITKPVEQRSGTLILL